ncbi:MAG: phosphate acyltransferase PlsX [Defluviitaleaceae bacterium]|nr:phosphate acyltransferase PlsX [Defluviitaleaceae bacterium]
MRAKVIVAVDAMGGDNAPNEVIKGSVRALANKNLHIKLFGPEDIIRSELANHDYDESRIEIIHAPEIVKMDESPTKAVRTKQNSSMIMAVNSVKEGFCDALVSAGNSGALLAGSTSIIGRIKGIERPVLGTPLPNAKDITFLLDSGANMDCKPSYLVQFAKMGSIYMEFVHKKPNPRVALINVGMEREKGNALTKEVYTLLENEKTINFIGNIEARSIPKGECDVAVCDAFVGNVILKYTEGMAGSLMGMIKEELMATTLSKIGAMMARGSFVKIKKRFDYAEIGGAPFLGLKRVVIKAHGSSDHRAIRSAIHQAYVFSSLRLCEEIEKYCLMNKSLDR